jgi:Lhr-like helicase/predicted RecB family nuclease
VKDVSDRVPSPLLLLPNTFRAFYGAFAGLHPLQRQAIEPVLDNRDIILQSATGSGKTEAVLAPCLEQIMSSGRVHSAIYIVPTRALAFDIRRRFSRMLRERLGVRLEIRTGDVKSGGGSRPDIMLTTPESLDVMLGSNSADVRGFLERVRTVIIDEVHPFIYQYRGQQLVYLFHRLERRLGECLQKIALSATIADPDEICRFLHFKSDYVLLSENVRRQIHPRFVHLRDDEFELINLLVDLSGEWHYRKILIFANSRGRCDKIFALLNSRGAFQGNTLLHYSNLNAKERQLVERKFRRQPRAVCVATSTLELGIDVGDVDVVLLFEPPDSVAAFLQRIGRANRRQKTTHFWGICRGARAGEQLLRFMALLHLAEKGRVEAALPKRLPSVLSQQFISCLYEKKRVTSAALRDLFSNIPEEEIKEIFSSLIAKKWFKETEVKGLYGGGYQYWQAFVEYRIWSNFPENEDLYQLLVANESVADIPKSIVRQIEPGDRVLLAGRRLRIVWIDDEGEIKRVFAEPAKRVDEKELYWLGKGSHVSYEVAQAMRTVLNSTNDAKSIPYLFSRCRQLFSRELEKEQRAIRLDNGIEVVRLANGTYQYRTFIGAVGNLILSWSVKEFFALKEEDVQVLSDEIGLYCSARICFEHLRLPVTEGEFTSWLRRHFKMMRAMFSLNAFCHTLPPELLSLELAGFIRDQRLLDFFNQYRNKTSEIVAGDLKNLCLPAAADQKNIVWELPSQSPSLLEREKNRRSECVLPVLPATADYQVRALTGTIIGGYFRYQQCARWLCIQFLLPENQPVAANASHDEITRQRLANGLEFEKQIISRLTGNGAILGTLSTKTENGSLRSIRERFAETLSWFEQAGQQKFCGKLYLVQPVLSLDAVLSLAHGTLPGIGIPDLIQVQTGETGDTTLLQVGDIKNSHQPRYYQKWQVAFYGWLLQSLIEHNPVLSPFRLAETGFLLTPSDDADFARRHVFSLKPYFSSIKAVFNKFQSTLAAAPSQVFWHVQQRCITCPGFECCYQQALCEQDIQCIPGIRRGELEKMHAVGITSCRQDLNLGEIFSSKQKKLLQRAMNALCRNTIIRAPGDKDVTDLFPANISTIFCVQPVVDPVTAMVTGIALLVKTRVEEPEIQTWPVDSDLGQPEMWHDFSRHLLQGWSEAIKNSRGPHLLFFGSAARSKLLHLAECMNDQQMTGLFAQGQGGHWTDLQQVFTHHFSLPIPGILTLYSLNQILALMPEIKLPAPESCFHRDIFAELEPKTICTLLLKLWQWLALHLKSRWHKDSWQLVARTDSKPAEICQTFIKAEKMHREQDLASLMELSLAERIEQFRAMGPLKFVGTGLDNEGKFLHLFTQTDRMGRQKAGAAKFRTGDFLRLVPFGVSDFQSGIPVIMAESISQAGEVALYLRKYSMGISKDVSYSLEEESEDFLSAKLLDVVQRGLSGDNQQINRLFTGELISGLPHEEQWLQSWLQTEAVQAHLNASQQQALQSVFQYNLSLIVGPPGTGKTHLLGWILVALIRQAQARGTPLRIAVSALTHKAIDQVLRKLVMLINTYALPDFQARCLKWGVWEGKPFDLDNSEIQVELCRDAGEILSSPYVIVGATGFGFYTMLHNQADDALHRPFDWIIFDEASQLLLPQALLALIHGKGNFLFLGDTCQLPPIIRSPVFAGEMEEGKESFAAEVRCSVLKFLLKRYPRQRRQLDVTYRMNADICRFPSRTWYDGFLHPAPENAETRLILPPSRHDDLLAKIIDPSLAVVLVGIHHQGCSQESAIEAELLVDISCRLLQDHELSTEQLALITPHRAQNNAIAGRLAQQLSVEGYDLPVIDTVERMQGAERDVILFGFTCSDPDLMFSDFLNNPNRFNVILTRARYKLIVVGSTLLFESVAQTEKQLQSNSCFKDFVAYCRNNGWYFEYG